MIEHGGALGAAVARFGGRPETWLDLSTGISPVQVELPEMESRIWRQLPDPSFAVRVAKGAQEFYGGKTEPVISPGSQAAIQHLPRLAEIQGLSARRVAILSPTYGEYEAAFERAGFETVAVSRLEDAGAFDVVVLANPNNPDGRQFGARALAEFAAERGSRLTIVDEAFADMHQELSVVAHAGQIDGLVVLRSFGKFFGLAGLRLGFVFASDQLTKALGELLGPWAVSGPALAVASHVFDAARIADDQRKAIGRCHAATRQAIEAAGCRIVGDTALFFLLETEDGASFRERLAKRQILVRAFDHSPTRVRIGLAANEAEAERLRLGLAGAVAEEAS